MKLIIALTAGLLFQTATWSAGTEDLAKAKGCLVCHNIDKKVVGPSYKEIATKYAGKADVAALSKKIISGGSGSFGAVAMPPNPQVKPEEAKELATWILGLK